METVLALIGLIFCMIVVGIILCVIFLMLNQMIYAKKSVWATVCEIHHTEIKPSMYAQSAKSAIPLIDTGKDWVVFQLSDNTVISLNVSDKNKIAGLKEGMSGELVYQNKQFISFTSVK